MVRCGGGAFVCSVVSVRRWRGGEYQRLRNKSCITFLQVDGLMDEESCYYVAVPHLADVELIPPNRSSKQLEDLPNSGFQSHLALNFAKLKTKLHPKAVVY